MAVMPSLWVCQDPDHTPVCHQGVEYYFNQFDSHASQGLSIANNGAVSRVTGGICRTAPAVRHAKTRRRGAKKLDFDEIPVRFSLS
jgi:hypothetical protein